jgi:hypothetical protein
VDWRGHIADHPGMGGKVQKTAGSEGLIDQKTPVQGLKNRPQEKPHFADCWHRKTALWRSGSSQEAVLARDCRAKQKKDLTIG